MGIIKIMTDSLSNKIAAGEVVEKTMNVVKELVENSIDAKSTMIKIELIDSGIKEIKVVDNGIGMSKEDAFLCFSRHATSKLKDESDLFRVISLGFRGEALPSIASVSKVILKTSNKIEGVLIEINGGNIIKEEESDLTQGTTFIVRDLFYNTPVRLKYLKSLYSELANIVEYINKMALSYPNIKFILKNNDKILLNTDGSNRLLKVINDIYGKDITKKMIEIKGENKDYLIDGYISLPEVVKNNKNHITTLVNGRYIKNTDLNRYIIDSYHTYIASDKYPIIVLNIQVDPLLIDINIHPTKMDIKFSNQESLKEIVTTLVSDKLSKLTLIPEVEKETETDQLSLLNKLEFNYNNKEKENPLEIEKISFNLEINEDISSYTKKENTNENRIKEIYVAGLVHGTYIIGENEDGMYLIDQHAANERINYEYYLKSLTSIKSDQIDLLIPITLEFSNNEYIILKENFNILDSLFIEYEEFGINTIIIRSIPLWLSKSRVEQALRNIIDIIINNESFDLNRFYHNIASSIACKASIKANEHVSTKELEELINKLRRCDNPFSCPHGRPVIISYSKYELEKLFKRSV